jgi:hypothetical protein
MTEKVFVYTVGYADGYEEFRLLPESDAAMNHRNRTSYRSSAKLRNWIISRPRA